MMRRTGGDKGERREEEEIHYLDPFCVDQSVFLAEANVQGDAARNILELDDWNLEVSQR